MRLFVGHSLFSSAVVTLIVRARLQGLDESLEEAAADLGATPARAFRQITLPLMFPALLAGALLAFTFSLDNTIVSTFVSTAGSTTLPVYVFSSVRSVIKPDIGGGGDLDARAHARRAGVRRVRAATRRRLGRRRRGHPHRELSEPVACRHHAK